MRELEHDALLNGVAASTVSWFVLAVIWFVYVITVEQRILAGEHAISQEFYNQHSITIVFGPSLFFLLLIIVLGTSLGTSGDLAYFNLVSPALLIHPEVRKHETCVYLLYD